MRNIGGEKEGEMRKQGREKTEREEVEEAQDY